MPQYCNWEGFFPGHIWQNTKMAFLKASAATIQIEVQLHVGPFQLTTGWNWFSVNANHLWFHHGIRIMWEWNLTMSENQNQLTNNSSISMYMDVSWLLKENPGALLKPTTFVEGNCIWLHFAGSNQPRPSKGCQLLRRRKDEPVFMQHIDTILQPQNHWTHPMINWPAGKICQNHMNL